MDTAPAVPKETEPEVPEPVEIAGKAAPSADDSQIEVFVNELVARIETSLIENVRAMVEARLPEVAREIIREEIREDKERNGIANFRSGGTDKSRQAGIHITPQGNFT